MKQIKTIISRRDYPGEFDRKVNEAIESGWELKGRFMDTSHITNSITFYPILIAYLEREV